MKIKIIAPLNQDRQEAHIRCGDYWVKKDLEYEFLKKGYEIVEEKADLDFYLFGNYDYVDCMSASRRFCWVYSHPNLIQASKWATFSEQFEHIFVLSNTFLSKINNNSSVLLGASSKEFIPRKEDTNYDVMFVGNSSKFARVELMKYLIKLNKYKICLVGDGWKKRLGKQINKVDYKGKYIDNNKLGEFFNKGVLSFYSAHEDMRVEGFVAVRILDIFRSSNSLCISDDNPGLKDMFQDIPTYKNKEELSECIDWFLQHPKEREEIASKCRKEANQFTFDKVVTEIEKYINKK